MAENETTIIQISRDLGRTWMDYTRCTPEQADAFFVSAKITAPKDGKHFRAKPNFGWGKGRERQISHTTLQRTLHASFDVSLLTEGQLAYLEGAVMAQSEECADYPSVSASTWTSVVEDPM